MARAHGYMTVTRIGHVVVARDAAGVPETEAQDYDLEVEIEGAYVEADPDVGLGAGVEDITAKDVATGEPVELTEKEEERAQEVLLEAHQSAFDE